MLKIKRITFQAHPVLGDLSLDFSGMNGSAVDTIIFAGENGTGKSTILNAIYKIATNSVDFPCTVIIEKDAVCTEIRYDITEPNMAAYAYDGHGKKIFTLSREFIDEYPFSGIFSDVDINFHSNPLSTVTSLTLDENKKSRKSTTDLPTQINQLLIDIQALDDAALSRAARLHPELPVSELGVIERMPRFTSAFARVFNGLTYDRIENHDGHKEIIFKKGNAEFQIDSLSSGEKQIIYRGCFLLKDANALNGAFVLIDEPEISLHPLWQEKIMDYYKGIFTDDSGNQTSQIFVVTHSPFLIHNEHRKNDKVIVLMRDGHDNIAVSDRPEYYKCNSIEAVRNAFYVQNFSKNLPTVYVEGRTDEKYFKKALDVFDYDVPFQFKWIGHIGKNGQEENSGASALNKAVSFLIGQNCPVRIVCLFDCDTKREETETNNIYTRVIPCYTNSKRMKKGIENALILDTIDTAPFYSITVKEGDYGDDNTISEFRKMDFCNYICSLEDSKLKDVFENLKKAIDSLTPLFE